MLSFKQFLLEKKVSKKKPSPFKYISGNDVPNNQYLEVTADNSDKRAVDSPSFGSSRAI